MTMLQRGDHFVAAGASAPLGATVCPGGVNFSVFSRNATLIELLLFDDERATRPARVIPLGAGDHRTYHYWHVFVPDLQPGQVYAYRAHDAFTPNSGCRFDGGKVLLDPYGLAVSVPDTYDRWAAARPGDNAAVAMRSVVADPDRYDWEGDLPLRRPLAETVIYELHVGGFTRHPGSGVEPSKRGTYAGLIEKIPYLKDLGVTALQLLPVFQFDAQDAPPGRVNYWGYQPVSFFAPHHAYSSRTAPLAVLDEFRDMVKALHRAGLEVILDVVFNHTAEGRSDGPILCFRGLADDFYYILEKDKSRYADYSGCGNILRFVKALNAFRQRRDVLVEGAGLSLNQLLRRARIDWHGVRLGRPDWSDHSHSLAFTVETLRVRFLLHGIFNAYWEPLAFELPWVAAEPGQEWRCCMDTALASPDDIDPWSAAAVVKQTTYVAQPRSVVILAPALEGAVVPAGMA